MKVLSFLAVFSIIFLFSFLFIGCSENENIDINTETTTGYSLELLAPVGSIEPSFCCIEFEWLTDFDGESRLQLANDALFTDLVLDTLVDAQSFSLETALAPNTQFYWAIEINDTLREMTTFTTEDVISPYEGIYSVEMSRYRWSDGPASWDTTYHTSIEIIVEDNSIYLIDSSSDFAEYHHFYNYENQYLLTYVYDDQSPYNSGAFVKFDLQTDSIFGGGSWSLLGGGTNWEFRGKME